MMGLQDFMEKVSAEVKKRLGKEYRVERKKYPQKQQCHSTCGHYTQAG